MYRNRHLTSFIANGSKNARCNDATAATGTISSSTDDDHAEATASPTSTTADATLGPYPAAAASTSAWRPSASTSAAGDARPVADTAGFCATTTSHE